MPEFEVAVAQYRSRIIRFKVKASSIDEVRKDFYAGQLINSEGDIIDDTPFTPNMDDDELLDISKCEGDV